MYDIYVHHKLSHSPCFFNSAYLWKFSVGQVMVEDWEYSQTIHSFFTNNTFFWVYFRLAPLLQFLRQLRLWLVGVRVCHIFSWNSMVLCVIGSVVFWKSWAGLSMVAKWKFDSLLFQLCPVSYETIVLKQKCRRIFKLQILKCEGLLIVFVMHGNKLNIFEFWTAGQTKTSFTVNTYVVLLCWS